MAPQIATPSAFSLVAELVEDVDDLRAKVAKHYHISSTEIEDVLPCSKYQQDVLAWAARNPQDAVGQAFFEVSQDVDLNRLRSAWSKIVSLTPALRTRIYGDKDDCRSYQTVLLEDIKWKHVSGSIDEVARDEKTAATESGARCNRYAVATESKNARKTLVWTFNNALVDNTSRRQIVHNVHKAYNGKKIYHQFGMKELLQHVRGLATKQDSDDDNDDDEVYEHIQGNSFPHLPTDMTTPRPRAYISHKIKYSSSWHRRPTTIISRAAITILLSRYTRSGEVAFDVLEARPPAISGEKCIIEGPTKSLLRCREQISSDQSLSELLGNLEKQDNNMYKFEQLGTSADEGPSAVELDPQILLAITEADVEHDKGFVVHHLGSKLDVFLPYTNRALLLECQFGDEALSFNALHDPDVIDASQTRRFLRQFGRLIEQICNANANVKIAALDATTIEDLEEIRDWNFSAPAKPQGCIHDLVSKWVKLTPQKLAVSAWDGDLTYEELRNLSSRLAVHLQSLDISPECIVPLSFEKSKWTVVSMLAVLQAGGAITLIDHSLPKARVEAICKQISPKVSLVCESQKELMQTFTRHCLVVDEVLLQSLSAAQQSLKSTAKLETLAIVQFTSGSTGEPKGSMIEHQGITSFISIFEAAGMGPSQRILQYASYAYAVVMTETLGSLITGACLCIPSEHDRINDLSGFIKEKQVNYAILIPSFARTVDPDSVPSLKTLMLVGEPMTLDTRDIWADRLKLLNAMGQSECLWSGLLQIDADTTNVRAIGRGNGTRLWIIEPGNKDRLAPIGCPGELMIESCGVSRGYLNKPELSATKFHDDAPSWYGEMCEGVDTARFYTSGDFTRYQHDGSIVSLGREDSQKKIRGQRVELGEVEFYLKKIVPSSIVDAVVDVVKPSHGHNAEVLVAFLIGTLDTDDSDNTSVSGAHIVDSATASTFANAMGKQVGQHAIPSCYISLKDLPLGGTGKADRGRLRKIGIELLDDRNQNVASRSKDSTLKDGLEEALAALWTQSMPVETKSIAKTDNFFDLGGDSIVAISMVNKAREAGLKLKVADILENPVFSDLVVAINKRAGNVAEDKPIPVKHRDSHDSELSYAQRGLWFLEQLNPGTPAYNVSIAARLRGPLQMDALRSALQALEARHEALRTTFKERHGAPVQIIHECRSAEDTMKIIEIGPDANFREELYRQQTTAFDLQTTPPWRVAVLQLSANDNVVSIVMHHIISDGWSDDVLRRELAKLYSAALAERNLQSELEQLPIQYRDFVSWQHSDDQEAEQQKQLQYWIERLEDSSPAELLTDKPRPAMPSGLAGVVSIKIEGTLYQELQKFCKAEQTTPFVVLLAAYRAAHYRLTGVDDATIGTPNASRFRSELEPLIGFFSNTQCLRITVSEGESFKELVQQVKETVTRALAHQDVPFERVVQSVLPGSRDASRNPLVQLLFAVHSQPNLGMIQLEGLDGETLQGTESTRFDAEFHLVQRKGEIQGNMLYAKELFEPETVRAVLKTFEQVLQGGLSEANISISSLRLSDGVAELRERGLLEIPRTDYPRDSSIVDIFSKQAAESSDTIAAKDATKQLTYADLDHESDILAAYLRRRRLPAETWVAVLAPRSCQTIVTFLGILKANLAYVPLDVEAPVSRINGILEAFEGPKLVLVGGDVEEPKTTLEGFEFLRIPQILEQKLDSNGDSEVVGGRPTATSLAYVMFTSGSTGKPKGVMIEHRGVVRLVKETNVLSDLPSRLVVAHLFNIAFDLSVWEIYTALLNGGTVVCIDAATKTDINTLEKAFKKEKIQAAMLPPVLLKACLASAPEMLKGLAAFYNGADRFDSHDAIAVRKLVPMVINAYGPTEASALSTIYSVQQDDTFTNGVPIGAAISNSGAYVMDVHQNLVSLGVMGELVVTGDGIARGYTDSALDKDRFIDVEIENKKVRAYRTGDRVRYRPKDGQVEFFGRLDRQIKIRGFRIEMADVENTILRHVEVDDAGVVVTQHEGEDSDLIGFITTHDDTALGDEKETIGQVESWGQQFDTNFYDGIDDIEQDIVGSDFLGWTSMYDGNKIDRQEMQEWLNETMETMLDGQPAGRVLEIGAGTGMILFNLGKGLESFVGIDPSKPAVNFAKEKVKGFPDLADKIVYHTGAATDIGKIDDRSADLVVINSVVQYFPSPEYLYDVVESIAKLPNVKRAFFGDIRSYATNRQFLASRALHKFGNKAEKDKVRQEMTRLEDREEELLVAPSAFTGLVKRFPELIEHVEILPKKMKATNELSSYRYNVMVYFKKSDKEPMEIHTLDAEDWKDFSLEKMDLEGLTQLLETSQDAQVIAISNIPYRRTILERHVVDMLDAEDDPDVDDKETWLSEIRATVEKSTSFTASDLIELGRRAGFATEVSCARQTSQSGGLDVIFHHYQPSRKGARVLFEFPVDDEKTSSMPSSNRPLQGLRKIQVEKRVRDALQSQLPSYMIPQRNTVLDKMPTNDNGKVDRKQLAKLARKTAVLKSTTSRVPAANEEEKALCEEFSNVLGVDVGPTDDFFALGGHSLMAMKLIPRVRDHLGWHILLRDLYQNSTPRALYESHSSGSGDSEEGNWPSYMEVHSQGEKTCATLVLIHGFWGQGRIFAELVPLLDEHLDLIILHDPFFGKAEGPQTLDAWSKFYLKELSTRLPRDGKVILGGYSFGGFTAIKMASLWRKYFKADLLSLLLLDPAIYEPVNMNELSKEFLDEKFDYGLRLFGKEQRAFVEEHFKKFGPLIASPREPPEYEGTGLHIVSSQVAEQGVRVWWKERYPQLEQTEIESTHHGLFEWAHCVKQVSRSVNEHCAMLWEENGYGNAEGQANGNEHIDGDKHNSGEKHTNGDEHANGAKHTDDQEHTNGNAEADGHVKTIKPANGETPVNGIGDTKADSRVSEKKFANGKHSGKSDKVMKGESG